MRPAETQWLIAILFLVAAAAYYAYKNWNAALPNVIVGQAWVVDGDTVVINNTRIRLARHRRA